MGLWGYFAHFAGLGNNAAASNHRLYAVGDTHGCANTLRKVLDKIYADIERHPKCRPEIVFMADYCDRGPDTRGVLDTLCQEKKKSDGIKRTFLKGNHDAEFLSFINAPKIGIAQLHLAQMITNGGLQTLASYGAYVPDHLNFTHEEGGVNSQNLHVGRRLAVHMWSKLRAALPQEHRKFLSELETRYTPEQAPHLFFCHAGVNPVVAIDAQQEAVLLGMEYDRELKKEVPFNRIFAKSHGQSGLVHNRVIVCGHHQRSMGVIEQQKNEHGLIFTDAGACMGGELAAVVFVNGEKKGIISTRSRYPTYNPYTIPEEPWKIAVYHKIFLYHPT
jgi:serine/threonine protein phosphatase 1